MQLTREQVAHIAHLARIALTEQEEAKFAVQLSNILQYVEILNEVDTEKVEATAQVTGLQNTSAPDVPLMPKDPTPESLLECSPNPVEVRQIKVHSAL